MTYPVVRTTPINNSTLWLRVFLAAAFVAFAIACPGIVQGPEEAVLALLSLLMFAAIAAPIFFRRDHDLFEPLTFVALLTVAGFSLKLLYVLAFNGRRDYVDLVLLNGRPLSVLIYGTCVVGIGLGCLLFGYCQRRTLRIEFFSLVAKRQFWNERRLAGISMVVIVISALFFVLFARSTGVRLTSIGAFTQKRFIDHNDRSLDRNYREESLQTSNYYFYRIAACVKFVFYLNLGFLIHKKKGLQSLSGMMAAWAGLQTLALFFCMNSRASVGLLLLDALIISYYMKGRFSARTPALGAGVASLLLLVLLGARAQRTYSPLELAERTVAGRDMMDVTKMALIIDAVPGQLDYCYGETLVGWLAAPIPLRIWPDKPLWAERGVYINQRVYGANTTLTGVPPGFPAELYWNFGWAGVCLGMFLAGVVLRSLYLSFQPYRNNPCAGLIYAIAVSRLTLFTLGSDLGTGILKTALDVIPLALLIFLVARPASRTPHFRTMVRADGVSASEVDFAERESGSHARI